MTTRMRNAIAAVVQEIEGQDLIDKDLTCSFRHPIRRFITPEMRKKLDVLYAALIDEPGPSRAELMEVD